MKKRVLVFVPEFPVISETFIERELSELAKSQKIELKIYALKKGADFSDQALSLHTEYINLSFTDILFGKLYYLFKKPSKFFECLRIATPKRYFLFVKSLGYAKIFSKFNPDIIYSHFMSTPSTIGLFASILLEKEFAISAHARDVFEYPDLPREKLERAKFITICNKTAYKHFLNLCVGMSTSKVHLLFHGIPKFINSFSANKSNHGGNMKEILFIGRLVEKKGVRYLLESIVWLKENLKEYPLTLNIIGSGPLMTSLKDISKKLKIEDHVVFTGELPFEKTITYFQSANIYVQPSINMNSGDSDGIPNTLIEAAMASLPIVTTDAGSIADFLDETNALVVSQKDSIALAKAIRNLILDDNLAQRLAKKANEKALVMFDIKNNVEKIERLLV
ncbi:glycosyltransferase family 4 protein [candidate division WWE3 bacterium]|nr:glycosyltransferase family 4 protein [candidate division WWE3 bacterium]